MICQTETAVTVIQNMALALLELGGGLMVGRC